jgi:hypothetical protein
MKISTLFKVFLIEFEYFDWDSGLAREGIAWIKNLDKKNRRYDPKRKWWRIKREIDVSDLYKMKLIYDSKKEKQL